MAEHTPIPWRRNGHFVETATKPPFAVCDVYGEGQILQEVGDLIVRAANCHEELVAAVKRIDEIAGFRGIKDIDDICLAALAKVRENTAHETRLQQQDLDEETL